MTPAPSLGAEPGPLCVDLDGTLVAADLLVLSLRMAARSPHFLLGCPFHLVQGRAAFKAWVARQILPDLEHLPWHQPFLAWLRSAREAGRPLLLATAADSRVAHAVAEYLGFFDGVLASDGITNLKGSRKAAALEARYGRGRYVYAGNSRADLPVWRSAGHAVVVNASPQLLARVRTLPCFRLPLPTLP
jgi:phosphoserine phosphatase